MLNVPAVLLTIVCAAAAQLSDPAPTSPACPGGTASADDVAAITQFENDWSRADKTQDMAWFRQNFAEELLINGSPMLRKDYIKPADPETGHSDLVEIEPPMNIRVFGDVAVVTGVQHAVGQTARGPFDRRFRFTDILVRCGRRWIVVANHFTVVR